LIPAPGLVSLTAAARRDTAAGLLWDHTQPLPGGLPVVVAPPGADYTRAALATLADSRRRSVSVLRGAAAPLASTVIADCGRLDNAAWTDAANHDRGFVDGSIVVSCPIDEGEAGSTTVLEAGGATPSVSLPDTAVGYDPSRAGTDRVRSELQRGPSR